MASVDEIERVECQSPTGVFEVKTTLRPSIWCSPVEIRLFTVMLSVAIFSASK